MFRIFVSLFASLPLVVTPALAAETAAATGITAIRPAMFLFTIAAALLLTLLLRRSVTLAGRYLVRRAGDLRMRRALARRSRDVMSDFVLPGAYGGLVHVDHAAMTSGGILCIRAIHLSGVVFGGEDDPQWTHVDGTRRRRFLNPLIQNEGRARAMRKAVGDAPVANLVVFTGNVEFPSPPPGHVIRLSALDGFIDKYVFGPSRVEDWDAVWMSLESAAMTDEATRKDLAAQLSFS